MLTPRWLYESGFERLLSLHLDWELKNGNAGRTKHFGASARQRRDLESVLRSTPLRYPLLDSDFPVVLVITRILGPRQSLWDHSSILRGNSKELIDAMVAASILPDDSPRFVRHVVGNQDSTRRQLGPAIEVQVWPGQAFQEVSG